MTEDKISVMDFYEKQKKQHNYVDLEDKIAYLIRGMTALTERQRIGLEDVLEELNNIKRKEGI